LATTHQIWEGIRNSDISALEELYQLYHQVLFNYGKKMSGDQQLIEDAIQETFISIWKYRQNISEPVAVKQYVLKAFRNQLLQIFKERSITTYTDESLPFSFEIAFDQKIVEGEDAEKLAAHINQALKQLTSRQQEIIYYRFYENLSFEKIAALMNMRVKGTYKLSARALAALKEIIDYRAFKLLLIFFK